MTEATGDSLATDPAMNLAAFRGRWAEASAMIESTTRDVMERGEGIWLSVAEFAEALLNNGIGDHRAALPPIQRAAEQADIALSAWASVELVEAAVRSGATNTAADTVARLRVSTSASGTDWALGVEARSRALLSDGAEADRLYRDAIERLGAHAHAHRTRACPSALWRMAAPGAPPRRRTHATAHRTRHARSDGHGGHSRSELAANCRPPGRPRANAPPPRLAHS